MQEIRSMMGERRTMQEALFYGFSLERRRRDPSGRTSDRQD
jgi:hypothetical protein